MLTPLPVNKRKPKFHVPDDETAEHDGSSDEDESEAESGSGSSSRDE
jgi:hypothetical protein